VILAPFYPILAGGSLAITLMDFPWADLQIRHIAKELILGQRKESPLGFYINKLSYGNKPALLFPAVTFMKKNCRFNASQTMNLVPFL